MAKIRGGPRKIWEKIDKYVVFDRRAILRILRYVDQKKGRQIEKICSIENFDERPCACVLRIAVTCFFVVMFHFQIKYN